jgi:hypothetical protein
MLTVVRFCICDQVERTLKLALDKSDTLFSVCKSTRVTLMGLSDTFLCSERAIDFMPPNQDSMVIIVDYKSTTLKTNPSISVARKVFKKSYILFVLY